MSERLASTPLKKAGNHELISDAPSSKLNSLRHIPVFGRKIIDLIQESQRNRLVERARKGVFDIFTVLHKADPLTRRASVHDCKWELEGVDLGRGKVVSAELDFHDWGGDNLGRKSRGLEITVRSTDSSQEDYWLTAQGEEEIEVQPWGERTPFDQFRSLDDLPLDQNLKDFADLTTAIANTMALEHESGSLVIHGPGEQAERIVALSRNYEPYEPTYI